MSETKTSKVDTNLAGTPDVPASVDPSDIEDGLGQSAELTKLQSLQKRMIALNDAMKQTQQDGLQINPDDPEALERHHELKEAQAEEAKGLAKEAEELAAAAGRNDRVPGKASPGGSRLHIPLVDKAWEMITKLLEMLFKAVMRGLTAVGIIKKSDNPENDQKVKTKGQGLGINLPTPLPNTDAAKAAGSTVPKTPVTAQSVEETFSKAIESTEARQKEIKAQKAELDAENELDDTGPSLGGKPPVK